MTKLPRYVRSKPLAGGLHAYYWDVPTWAKPPAQRHGRECPVGATPLGTDIGDVFKRAAVINDAFDGWRQGSGPKLTHGSVAWLFTWYRDQDRFTSKKAKTRYDYDRIMRRLIDEPMKIGTLGQRSAAAVNAGAADALYARWRKKHGERQASYAMQVCRLVWTWAVRHHDTTGVLFNPFKSMGIKSTAEVGNRPTTRAEYDLYRETARAMGMQSMATAAALSFELCQRVWDVFGFAEADGSKSSGFVWVDYRPGEYIKVTQSKTGKKMHLPMMDDDVSLFPVLEVELERTPRLAIQIVVDDSSGLPFTYDTMNDRHRAICNKAGLPKKMTFTGFRHGGSTELGDADVADIRPITGHSQINTTAIYNHLSLTKAKQAQRKRLEFVGMAVGTDVGITDAKGVQVYEK